MEIKYYLEILKRWFWFLFLCTVLGAGGGYYASRILKPTYQASTKILVSKDLADQNSQYAAMTTQQLIDTNVQLLSSASVVDEASSRLNYAINIKEIGQVQQVRTTPVIQITIEDSDPQRSAAIANMLVEVLIDRNKQASGYTSTEDSINASISEVEDQISTLQSQFNLVSEEYLQNQLQQANDQITALQNEIEKLTSDIGSLSTSISIAERSTSSQPVALQAQLAEKQAQLTQYQSLLDQYQQVKINLEYFGKPSLNASNSGDNFRLQLIQSTLDQYQKIHLDLVDNLHTIQLAHLRNTTTIDQIEKAAPPTAPVRPLTSVYTILAGVVGLVFAVGVIFINEYMDDTLKTPQDVQQAFSAPILGYIPNMKPISKKERGSPDAKWTRIKNSDALYALRTNLEFSAAQNSMKTLLLLDIHESGKEKTRIVADLAASYALSGKKVILLDADLRNPSIHSYLGLDNENGFSDILMDAWNTTAVYKKVDGLDGMAVITGGNASPATDKMVKPDDFVQILEILKQQADMIIIDAPPIIDANSWVLASKVDEVLLVIQPEVTHLRETNQALEQLDRARAKILGSVVFQIKPMIFNLRRRMRYHQN